MSIRLIFHIAIATILFLEVRPECPEATPSNPCTCEETDGNSLIVTCIETHLDRIPEGLPPAETLKFQDNFLEILDLPSTYKSVVSLHLMRNYIRYIKDSTFQEYGSLMDLNLAENQISSLRKETFHGLTELVVLNLNHNPIYELVDNVFNGSIPNLNRLFMANTQLYKVSESAFTDLTSLQHVNMTYNHLTEIPVFKNSPVIELWLTYNQIEEICNLPSTIQFLHLDYNRITSITADSVKHLQALEHLKLEHNFLASVAPQSLATLQMLTDLFISYNNLSELHKDWLPMKTLKKLELHHNPWNCDCQANWMRTDLLVISYNPEDVLTCAAPEEVANSSLYIADMHVFDCPDPHSHGLNSHSVAIAISILLVIVLILLGGCLLWRHARSKSRHSHLNMEPNTGTNASSIYTRVNSSREVIFSEGDSMFSIN